MLSELDQKQVDRLYQLLEREKDQDTAAALRWAIFTLENPPTSAAVVHTPGMTRKDFLTVWGCLETLKNTQEQKARDTAKRDDDIGRRLTADYMKQAAEVRTMQGKLDTLINNMED